jgi:hypothetical protein
MKHASEDQNMHLFLAQWTGVQSQTVYFQYGVRKPEDSSASSARQMEQESGKEDVLTAPSTNTRIMSVQIWN